MKSYKVKFSGEDYKLAKEEFWLDSLAIYLLIAKRHSGKSFYFKPKRKTDMMRRLSMRTGVSITSLHSHIKVLIEKGMITMGEGEMRLKSNRKMKSNNEKVLFIKEYINCLSDIKILLKNIPFLSNLKKQKLAYLTKEHNLSIHVKQQKGGTLTAGESKALLNHNKKNRGSFERSAKLTCGLTRMKEILNRKSNSTVCKYKKRLKELKLINYSNELYRVYSNVTYSDFTYLRSNDLAGYSGAFFFKGSIYVNRPTEFLITY